MRRAIWILFALTLGLVLNVLVAWRSAHVIDGLGPWEALPQAQAARLWEKIAPDIPVDETLNSFSEKSPSHRLTFLDQGTADVIHTIAITPVNDYETLAVLATGWPFQSLTGWRRESYTPAGIRYATSGMLKLPDRIFGIPSLGLDLPPHHLLPVEPIIFGTILNTLFYGSFVALVVLGIQHLRRRGRLDRKCCANCDYDLRGAMNNTTITCPECGSEYANALFQRPRHFWRWWLLPFMLPPVTLFLILFLGGTIAPAMLTLWSRVPEPRQFFTSLVNAVIGIGLLAAIGFLYLLTQNQFLGYPTWQRRLGALAMTAILFSVNYACLVILIEWAERAAAL